MSFLSIASSRVCHSYQSGHIRDCCSSVICFLVERQCPTKKVDWSIESRWTTSINTTTGSTIDTTTAVTKMRGLRCIDGDEDWGVGILLDLESLISVRLPWERVTCARCRSSKLRKLSSYTGRLSNNEESSLKTLVMRMMMMMKLLVGFFFFAMTRHFYY